MNHKRIVAIAILMLLGLLVLFAAAGLAYADGPARQVTFSGVANAPGAYGSYWRTEFSFANGSDSVITVGVADPQPGVGTGIFVAEVQPGETYATSDIVGDLGFEGSYALMFQLFGPAEAVTKVSISLRTYTTNVQGGTYGVVLPSLTPLAILEPKSIALLGSPNFRRAFYFYCWKWAPFTATGYDAAGHQVWQMGPTELALAYASDSKSISPALHAVVLPSSVMRVTAAAAGRPSPDTGFAIVYVTQADNITNAPVFLP